MGTWSDVLKDSIPDLLKLGSGLIVNNQVQQQAKGEANAQEALIQTQLEIAKTNQQTELAKLEALKTSGTSNKSSNTLLYVGLGMGFIAIIGTVIYIATRPKK